jgi:chromosome segregation ATPase
MPDAVKEMLPVSRKFFERAVKSLGEGIIHVRESLSEQMGLLDQKQDELGQKQDQTLSEVLTVKDEILDARVDIENVQESLMRCESSLSSSERLQDYTSRGVRLLVRCVATIFPGNERVLEELAQYIREADGVESVEVPSIDAQRNPSLSLTPEDEHPGLTPISRPAYRHQSPLDASSVSAHIQTNDKMDEIYSLLGLVRDGTADSRQYRSPVCVKA